jgi:hypothetical protein
MSAAILPFLARSAPAPVTDGNRRALDSAVLSVVVTATDVLARDDGAEHRACVAAERLLGHVLRYRLEADAARDSVLDRLLVARDWLHLAAAVADRMSRDARNLRVASDHNRRRVALEEAVATLTRATNHLRGWGTTEIRDIA